MRFVRALRGILRRFCSVFSSGLRACTPGNERVENTRERRIFGAMSGGSSCDHGVTRPELISQVCHVPATLAPVARWPRSTRSFLASKTLHHHGRRHRIPQTSTFRTYAGLHQHPHPWIAGQHPVCTGRNPRSTVNRSQVYSRQRRTPLLTDRNRSHT